MPRTKNPSYLQQRGNVWYAVLDIPKPLRKHFDGKPRFLQSLQTESRSEAERKKLSVIAGWKAEIEAAKTGNPAALRDLERAALDWRIGYLSEDEDQHEIASLEIESQAEEIAWKDKEKADAFYNIATGKSFPLGDHVEEWLSTLDDQPKTIHMKRTDLKRFADRFQYSHKVDKAAIRKWAQELEHTEGKSISTVRRIISPCRGYWDYLQRCGHIADDTDPFKGAVRTSKRKTKAATESRRKAFTPEDIVALLGYAQRAGDVPLGQLIWLGMWTGCRIEELCSLKCADVSGESFVVAEAKSAAGNVSVRACGVISSPSAV